MIRLAAALIVLIQGCVSHLPPAPLHVVTQAKPDAKTTLTQAGLWNEKELASAVFLANSDESMIVADLTSVPCRMLFSYVKTPEHPYWMPSQISCEGDDKE